MPPLPVLHIDPDEATTGYLQATLEGPDFRMMHALDAEDGLRRARSEPPRVIVLELDLPDRDGLEVIRQLRADPATGDSTIVVLTSRSDPSAEEAAREAGASEFVRKSPEGFGRLLRTLESIFLMAQAPPSPGKSSRSRHLVVFLSANGGSGTSTICVNLAHEIARFQPGRSVAVADLVLPIGSLAEITGVASENDLVSLTQHPVEEYGPEFLRRALPPAQPWGFHLLPGSTDPARAQTIRAERFDGLVGKLREAFDIVVVDIGKNLSRLSLKVLAEASLIVVVLIPETAPLSASRALLSYLQAEGIPEGKFLTLSNRPYSALGLAGGPLEAALARPVDAEIRHVGSSLALSNEHHLPLTEMAPDDPGSTDLHDLAVLLIARLRQGE
jgi:pilus assembly protein CpaE